MNYSFLDFELHFKLINIQNDIKFMKILKYFLKIFIFSLVSKSCAWAIYTMVALVALVDTIFLKMLLRGLLCIIFSLIKFDKVIPKQALWKERSYLSYYKLQIIVV